MVTLVENKTTAKYIGLSTDTKPTQVSDSMGMPNGSRFLEMDTGKKYYWSTESQQWGEMPSSGGGGGSSAAEAFWVTITPVKEWGEATSDKTVAEIKAAFDDGKIPYAKIEIADDGIYILPLLNIGDTFAFFGLAETEEKDILYVNAYVNNAGCETSYTSFSMGKGTLLPILVRQNSDGWYTPQYTISEIIEMIQEYKMTVVLQEESSGTIYQMCNLHPNAESIAFSAMKFETDSTTTPEYWLMTGYVSNNKQWVCNHGDNTTE